MSIRKNSASQSIDVAGSDYQNDNLNLSDELLQLGRPLSDGYGSEISVLNSIVTLHGLTGILPSSEGNFIELQGFSNIDNNGVFLISVVVNSSEIQIINSLAVNEVLSFYFIERQPYSLEDDINYERTDRSLIKGTEFYNQIPTYYKPSNTSNSVPANLANIAGNTTDAQAVVVNKEYYNVSVNFGDSFITLSDIGFLKHADIINILGVPINDGYDVNNNIATFAIIISSNDGYGSELTVHNGLRAGYRVYGRTRAGSSISPNSVEVEFRSIKPGGTFADSFPYVWEFEQPSSINIVIGYRKQLSLIEDTDFRRLIINGILFSSNTGSGSSGPGSGITEIEHPSLRQLIHLANNGPFEGFSTGAYKEIVGGIFPTQITWYNNILKTGKIVEKTIIRNDQQNPIVIIWNAYDFDGITIISTITDNIQYNGIFEASRIRSVS